MKQGKKPPTADGMPDSTQVTSMDDLIFLVCLLSGASIGAALLFVAACMRSSQISRDEEKRIANGTR